VPEIADIFSGDGILSQHLENYEVRPGQVKMASMVDAAIRLNKVLMIEAPTGAGKSLNYGVPAAKYVAENHKKVIIATALISLQEQLVFKDLPWMQQHLPWQFTYALWKGRSNYLCASRWDEKRSRPDFASYQAWVRTTRTGDKAELDFDASSTWFQISSSGTECTGPKCPHRGVCWAQIAKNRAMAADIIVVNYHLLYAGWEHDVLPEYGLLICDEAHSMADVARSFKGDRFSINSMKYVASQVDKYRPGALNYRVAQQVMDQAALFLGRKVFAQRRFRANQIDFTPIIDELESARTRLLGVSSFADDVDEAKWKKICEMVQKMSLRARDYHRGTTEYNVCWAQMKSKDEAFVEMAPITVDGFISSNIKAPTILTSATLTTGGKFDFVKAELGLAAAVERRMPYAFDYGSQGRLYIPPLSKEPNHPDFLNEACDEVLKIIPHVDGGVLMLCTSIKSMNHFVEEFRKQGWGRDVMRQGDMSRRLLLERMRSTANSVLVATRSFFEGVDIPGGALSCVIIDKLPFPTPNDPVVQSIQEKIEAKTGKNGWFQYSLPLCGMTMAQAAGRLLRRRTDRGVVICCDRRLRTKGYKSQIIKSLPPFTRTVQRANVLEFLDGDDF
jgi:ATP-dependent DNA helicase DinG